MNWQDLAGLLLQVVVVLLLIILLKRFNGTDKPNKKSDSDEVEKIKDEHTHEMLNNILKKVESSAKCLTDLKLDFVKYKTEFNFLAKTVQAQNGDLKKLVSELGKIAKECATRLVSCHARFEDLEEKVKKKPHT